MFDLAGRVALITVTAGVGPGVALAFARQGAEWWSLP